MWNFHDSSQLTKWMYTLNLLKECRERANREARIYLAGARPSSPSVSSSVDGSNLVKKFASGYNTTNNKNPLIDHPSSGEADTAAVEDVEDEWKSFDGNDLLTPEDEQSLIQFYIGKIPSLIGPNAQLSRLRRRENVTATASLLFCRFFLSNSVMMFDPKSIMVAAAFLASKIEDATANVHDLVRGTEEMQALVSAPDILIAELHLLTGIDNDLMCHHPYKTVLAYTEDLRNYLKSERGRKAASVVGNGGKSAAVIVSGEDLRPMHDNALLIVNDAIVSDIPLMHTPGQIGLAAMIVANDDVCKKNEKEAAAAAVAAAEKKMKEEGGTAPSSSSSSSSYVKINLNSYMKHRFESRTEKEYTILENQMTNLTCMLRELKDGKHGCGKHIDGIDNNNMTKLKLVHKKLKKCKRWGKCNKDDGNGNKKKKKKKRKATSQDVQAS